jgi:hypothetical protein
MIPQYLTAAVRAPLRDRPSHLVAEVAAIAERDRISPFAAALQQLARDRAQPEPELAL